MTHNNHHARNASTPHPDPNFQWMYDYVHDPESDFSVHPSPRRTRHESSPLLHDRGPRPRFQSPPVYLIINSGDEVALQAFRNPSVNGPRDNQPVQYPQQLTQMDPRAQSHHSPFPPTVPQQQQSPAAGPSRVPDHRVEPGRRHRHQSGPYHNPAPNRDFQVPREPMVPPKSAGILGRLRLKVELETKKVSRPTNVCRQCGHVFFKKKKTCRSRSCRDSNQVPTHECHL
ncbi:hypothetical protein C8J56DRAFT_961999 [Mycena floridula]|nr:hypothetical protein C8J56DRAFT_971238 [Mycena floridula]KAJ7579990.1 hypothetical protein C8J56DRAFT_961999 [Mycena floridula]